MEVFLEGNICCYQLFRPLEDSFFKNYFPWDCWDLDWGDSGVREGRKRDLRKGLSPRKGLCGISGKSCKVFGSVREGVRNPKAERMTKAMTQPYLQSPKSQDPWAIWTGCFSIIQQVLISAILGAWAIACEQSPISTTAGLYLMMIKLPFAIASDFISWFLPL